MKIKKIKIFALATVMFAGINITSLKAQSAIDVEASQMVTNFVFTNSLGEQQSSYLVWKADNEYKPAYSGAYHLGYSYTLDMGMFFRAHTGMRKSGATMVYDDANYQWDLQYLQGRLGIGYGYSIGMVAPYLCVSGYYSHLLKANQVIDNQEFNIKKSGDIEKNDFGLYTSPGVRIDASDYMSVYLELSYLMGLQNIETSDAQESLNIANAFTVGVSFNIQ